MGYNKTIEADLNNPSEDAAKELRSTLINADVLICTAALVYFTTDTIRKLVGAFAEGKTGAGVLCSLIFLTPSPSKRQTRRSAFFSSTLTLLGALHPGTGDFHLLKLKTILARSGLFWRSGY